jgi:hypothetical protein
MRTLVWVVATAIGALLLAPREAEAYIDPGSSSLLLQGIIGGVAAVIVLVRHYWRRMTAPFRRDAERPAAPDRRG